MALYAPSHCRELAQRWPEYDFSQVLIMAIAKPGAPLGVGQLAAQALLSPSGVFPCSQVSNTVVIIPPNRFVVNRIPVSTAP